MPAGDTQRLGGSILTDMNMRTIVFVAAIAAVAHSRPALAQDAAKPQPPASKPADKNKPASAAKPKAKVVQSEIGKVGDQMDAITAAKGWTQEDYAVMDFIVAQQFELNPIK